MRVLHLKLFGHFAASFRTEDLLATNPAIFVHQLEPALDDIKCEVSIPVNDGQKVEAFVP